MNEDKLRKILTDPVVQIHLKLGEKQSELIKDITEALKNINSLNPRFLTGKIGEAEEDFVSLQGRAVKLQQAVYQPFILLTEEEKENLPESIEERARIVASFSTMHNETSDERDRRISRLLEHLERRISDKRASVNFNRTTIFSLIAISVSVIALIVVVILHFI